VAMFVIVPVEEGNRCQRPTSRAPGFPAILAVIR